MTATTRRSKVWGKQILIDKWWKEMTLLPSQLNNSVINIQRTSHNNQTLGTRFAFPQGLKNRVLDFSALKRDDGQQFRGFWFGMMEFLWRRERWKIGERDLLRLILILGKAWVLFERSI